MKVFKCFFVKGFYVDILFNKVFFQVGEQISLAISITAGLPVYYQIDWGDGTVDKYHENSKYIFFTFQ
jgi:hypothetical protein